MAERSLRLLKREFYDVYGISLIAGKFPEAKERLMPRLLEIADKYAAITDKAVRREIRHIDNRACYEGKDERWAYGIYEKRDRVQLAVLERAFSKLD